MSVIFVLVGQCGNQLGEVLWRQLSESTVASPAVGPSNGAPPSRTRISMLPSHSGKPATAAAALPPLRYGPLFADDGYARCLLVDAEPKVVDAVRSRNPAVFRKENCVTGHSGRGNCWAAGYCSFAYDDFNQKQADVQRAGRKKRHAVGDAADSPPRPRWSVAEKRQNEDDELLLARVLRSLHDETLRSDDGGVEAIVVVHSLAGGTGSGLGSALVENIDWHFKNRDDDHRDGRRPPPAVLSEEEWYVGAYGERRRCQYVVSMCVAPRLQGETTVQSFNTTMTLRTILPTADAVVLLRNDVPGMPTDVWTVTSVNNYFTEAIIALLQGGLSFGAIGEMITKCCPLRSHNLLTVLPLTNVLTAKSATVASANVPPWLIGFHRSAISATLYNNPQYPAPPALKLDAFLHDSVMAAANVLTGHVDLGAVVHPSSSRKGGLQSCCSALVLNQGAEVTRVVLFPMLADCYRKVQAKAFLHNYAGMATIASRLFPSSSALRMVDGRSAGADIDRVGIALRTALSEVAESLMAYPGCQQ